MKVKAVSGAVLMLLLVGLLPLVFDVQPANAEPGTIYIRPDGSINPPTAPIQRDGDLYIFTSNINEAIVIERSNIVVDGVGYTLYGAGGIGIDLSYRSNVTIKRVTIRYFGYGIRLSSSSNNTISGTNVTNCNSWGIRLDGSSNNTISGNNIRDNYNGALLYSSSNNTISGNTFCNCGLLVSLSYRSIIVDNLVNGKPLVYLEDVSDYVVDDAGQVILVNCTNILVENLDLSSASFGVVLWATNSIHVKNNNITNNNSGVELWYSNNSTISGNNITNNGFGIDLHRSSGSNIYGNNITNNHYGIYLSGSSNNTLGGNNITSNNWAGILLYSSSDNTIYGNNITNNHDGLSLDSSSRNNLYHNNFINNIDQVYVHPNYPFGEPPNLWDASHPSGGNYWSDYTGVDGKSGPNQDQSGSDGIGDTAYVIDVNNLDRYPLMHPWSHLPIHDMNTGLGYTAIQEAIDAPETLGGHTIFVEAGTYYENLVVNKSIALVGEDRVVTTIDGNMTATVVAAIVDNVTISEFTIQNGGGSYAGISLSSNGSNIINNILWNNWHGITGELWSDTTIIGNTLKDNLLGIWIGPHSNRNTISFNNIRNHWSEGISMWQSSNNTIVGNNLTDNNQGANWAGITVGYSSYNKFFHNNVVNTGKQIDVQGEVVNIWDDGYPSGGNYWSDYNGTDPDNNGIGDTPYIIDGYNIDRYPLMKPWSPSLAITDIIPSKNVVGQSYSLSINITVQNLGTTVETFNVTLHVNIIVMATQTNITLTSGNSTTLTFAWNTSGFPKGYYITSAYATPVPGETDTTDNTYTDGWIIVTTIGDVDGDGDVDVGDQRKVQLAMFSYPGQPNWDPNMDIDCDLDVDVGDQRKQQLWMFY